MPRNTMPLHRPNHERPIMISLWAGPGVGKSRTRAGLFNLLKYAGYVVEESHEFAQMLHNEKAWHTLRDSFFVMANQERNNSRLIGEYDMIVTDSPPGLGLAYCPQEEYPLLMENVKMWRRRYRNLDIRLLRDPERDYETYGRSQTLEEAKEIDRLLDQAMFQLNIEAPRLYGDKNAPEAIAALLRGRMDADVWK